MRRLFLFLGAVLFVSAFVAGDLFAYNYSHSTSFVRTQARAATISSVDSVYYNPVGLVKMENGMYLDLGNQMGAKRYMHKFLFGNYHDATPSWIMPNLGLAWKNDRGAIFLSVYVPAGGGTVNYVNNLGIGTLLLEPAVAGLPILPSKLKAKSFWIQSMVGGSFAFTDWLAVTAGVKFSMYTAEQAIGYVGLGTVSKDVTTANGFSGFGGIMLTPVKEVSITALYSSKVIARGKNVDVKYHYSKIAEERLPDYILVGLNVKPTDTIELQAQWQMNFAGQHNYANTRGERFAYIGLANQTNFAYADLITPTLGGNSENYKYRHDHKVGLGAEFTLHKMFLASLGVSYGTQEKYPRAQVPFDPNLRNIGVGLGFKIMPSDKFSIELGGAKYTYFTDHMAFGLIKLNKSVWSFGIGLTAKVM
ncbi:MAG: hypothetical protein JW838_10715 [Spirochaetes bacterium]|nr:hypothetical protein [Spirochaetota bacterium]